MPSRGQCYTREEIAAAHGGGTIEYLPNVADRVVCACLRTDPNYNPAAPRVILPGRGRDIERWAGVLCAQRGPIPIYLKRAPNTWEHVGYYEVEGFSQSPADIARYEAQTGRAVTRAIYMREGVTVASTNEKKDALFELAENIRSHEDWWLFPAQDSIQGFMGTDPIFIVGDQPSNSEWLPSHPNRIAFYEHLQRVGVPNAHLTDLYKKRGKSGTLRAGLPNDFHDHVSLFRREIEILQPTRIVALGHLAYRLLMQHVPEQRPALRRMWHFSYVVRYGKLLQYEADMRRAIWGI